ncbi:hypothetical protein LXA43DRAFT_1016129, partial [Ganoderma leucocontextum]
GKQGKSPGMRPAAAADRHHALEFWEVFVLVNGMYNPTMRATLGTRLPTETKKLARGLIRLCRGRRVHIDVDRSAQ